MACEFDDLFDVVWDGRTELLPPRDTRGYAWSLVDGPGSLDKRKAAAAKRAHGSGGNHNPLGIGGPTKKKAPLGIGPARRQRMAERRREFDDLVRRFAPTRCACGCGGHLDQKSVTLARARNGEWSRFRQGHSWRGKTRRVPPGPGSLDWNTSIKT